MNFFGKIAFLAVGINGRSCKIGPAAAPYRNRRRWLHYCYDPDVVARNSTVVNVIAHDIPFPIAVPNRPYRGATSRTVVLSHSDVILLPGDVQWQSSHQERQQGQDAEIF